MTTEGPPDRHSYLEEQIARQKRGEPIDVEWVRGELERVRREQIETENRTRNRLLALSIFSAVLLAVLWILRGGLRQHDAVLLACVFLVTGLGIWSFRRRKR